MNSSALRFSFAITLSAACASAQSATPSGAPTAFDSPRSIELATSPAVIPLIKEGVYYFADVKVNGKPFRFTLETGAGFVTIGSSAARALGMKFDSIPPLAPGQPGLVAFIDSLTLGPLTYRGVTARVSSMFDNAGFDGLISIPLLRELLVTLDLARSRLVLQRGSLPAANGRDIVAIAAQDRGGRVDVPMDLGGARVPVVFDTRSYIPLTLPDSLEPVLRLEAPPRPAGQARGPSLGTFQLRGARLASPARLGDVTIERTPILFRDRPGAVMGLPLMEQMEITLDLRNSRVRIARPQGTPITSALQSWETSATESAKSADPQRRVAGPPPPPRTSGQRTIGFNLVGFPGGTSRRVENVVPESDAAKQGIRNGDEIVEFDGVPVTRMDPAVARSAVARTTIKVVVRRGTEQLTFSITPYVVP